MLRGVDPLAYVCVADTAPHWQHPESRFLDSAWRLTGRWDDRMTVCARGARRPRPVPGRGSAYNSIAARRFRLPSTFTVDPVPSETSRMVVHRL